MVLGPGLKHKNIVNIFTYFGIFWFYFNCITLQLSQNMANMNMGGPGFGGEIDLDSLPPPPPELLQQQYLYGTVPDSRQQGVYSQFATPQGQASQGFTPGTGNVQMPPPQKAGITNVPPSKPIQVKHKYMYVWAKLI